MMELEKEIREKAERYRDLTAKNLSELIRTPSLSGEEGRVIRKIRGMLKEAGIDEVRIDGLGNLIAKVGEGEKKLVIDAHIDTVDTGDRKQWDFDPFGGEIRDGFVYGRGAVDQKGGAASMITAGRILKELGYDGDFTIYFTFTIMEEDCDGLCWNYLIQEEGLNPDFVIITEPTNLGVYRGHRGRMEIEIYFAGVSAHGSAPSRGKNAIYSGARATLLIQELNKRLKEDDFLGKGTIAATSFESESPSLCSIPDKCKIHLDRRLTWGETKESAINEIREIVGDDARIVIPTYDRESYKGKIFKQEKYFPSWKIPEEHILIQTGIRTYERLFERSPVVG
ncbi:YgeY family selenium metabolism-linked hydrolase, partial [candidate division WOR-3 bacterium]|nr:YgeY family selenium metabolism-linked hydrolase [candidate division WOR-3 bacterium]